MNYEEKRELRLQISQLLADAGLNQGTIAKMVHDTVNSKLERAVNQCFERLNAESSSGDYVQEYINRRLKENFWTNQAIKEAVFQAIQDKTLEIVLKDTKVSV